MEKRDFLSRGITVRFLRFHPERDVEPYYQEYTVPLSFGMSVINILDYIYENIDGTLSYFTNCRRGLCGRCLVRVDGKPVLACKEMVTGDITVDPLNRDEIVKDLVIKGI
jgi:succinate dehydrogenase/fumarate reductase iron-sulfur protein